jgi:hypothetical protein
MRVESARQRCGYSVLAHKTHPGSGATTGGRLANCRCCCVCGPVGDVLAQLRMVVVRVVAAHDLASFEQPVGLIGMRLAPWDRVCHRQSDQGACCFCLYPLRNLCGMDLRPTSVFSRRNSRRHGYLQLVAKTLYTVDGFFHAPPASDSGQFHWWSDVFEPAANFIARGCRVA